ncbi:MAG: hypothetical protein SVU69_03835 [Pseudomonadota bacterium]|nr:hypothetical protein [Pseudomonadota bacterium]
MLLLSGLVACSDEQGAARFVQPDVIDPCELLSWEDIRLVVPDAASPNAFSVHDGFNMCVFGESGFILSVFRARPMSKLADGYERWGYQPVPVPDVGEWALTSVEHRTQVIGSLDGSNGEVIVRLNMRGVEYGTSRFDGMVLLLDLALQRLAENEAEPSPETSPVPQVAGR